MSLGLLGAYMSDSDESNSESDQEDGVEKETDEKPEEESEIRETLANPFLTGSSSGSANWLPKPSFMQETEKVSGIKFDNSVFSNPFRAKEDKKDAILEQHVEMTFKQEAGRTINGKKVCWNFRKGRCRHGHKCSFAHDSDVKTSVVESLYSPKYDTGAQVTCDKADTLTMQPIQMKMSRREEDDEQKVRKKRPGLSDGLQPSKKAMLFHKKVYN